MNPPSRYRVVATAGHVDHGKSSLVKALTGIDPDRLREEQERHMTIDLGFAWLQLPSGMVAGIIDVPGHRDFIHNMLAGVGGIDGVMLVVAADEGIMPQTREHIDILDLLGVRRGLVALTKVDLVEAEWLALVSEETREALAPTSLAGIPQFPVSAVTGAGLGEFRAALDELLLATPPPADDERPRLPVDRVFSLRGHGTIVTGTLVGGRLTVGEQVVLQPSGLKARIRSLQTHGLSLDYALPGSRVAANLAGAQREDVRRGDVLATGNWLRPTLMFDARLRHLAGAPRPLQNGDEVHLFSGTLDAMARVRLLESEELEPGRSEWAQLVCERVLPLARGDRFILRAASPSATIGGGVVLDAHSTRRHRRLDPGVHAWLRTVESASDEELVLLRLNRAGPSAVASVAQWLDAPAGRAQRLVEELAEGNRVIRLQGSASESAIVAEHEGWGSLTKSAQEAVARYHEANPLRSGMGREELRRALRLRREPFAAALDRWLRERLLGGEGDLVRLYGWQVRLSEDEQARGGVLARRLREAGTAGATVAELSALVGEQLLQAMFTSGDAVHLPDDVVLARLTYNQAIAAVVAALRERGSLTVAQVRDLLGSNRRVTLALLAHLDDQGVTRRTGDQRLPGRRFPAVA